MTKEELIKLSRENLRKSKQGSLCECYDEAFIKGYELSKKCIEELEQKISVLLSCKKCSENKGGYICQKEYEDKCLAQKIQYIKELQEENAELKADNDARKFAMAMSEKVEKQLREVNARLNRLSDMQDETVVDLTKTCVQRREQLTKAKEIIRELLCLFPDFQAKSLGDLHILNTLAKAEAFLNKEVEK